MRLKEIIILSAVNCLFLKQRKNIGIKIIILLTLALIVVNLAGLYKDWI